MIRLQNYIKENNSPYPMEAYCLIADAFDWFSSTNVCKKHITGQDLSRAVVLFSVHKYGLMAETIWQEMNITRSEDVGEIVRHMVELQILVQNEGDDINDFNDVLDNTILQNLEVKVNDNNFITYGVDVGEEKVFV